MSTEPHFDLIAEGQCPHGHGPLEVRRDDESPDGYGWCEECRAGFSIRTERAGGATITLHLRLEFDPS